MQYTVQCRLCSTVQSVKNSVVQYSALCSTEFGVWAVQYAVKCAVQSVHYSVLYRVCSTKCAVQYMDSVCSTESIYILIYVYTNKQQVVKAYLDMGRVF